MDKKFNYPKNITIYLDNCVKLFNETFGNEKYLFVTLPIVENWKENIINNYLDELNNTFNQILVKKDKDKLFVMSENLSNSDRLIKLSKISDETYLDISILFEEIKNLCNNI